MRIALLLAVGAALCLGLYARFKGLGMWPFAVDEYYLARSIQNVLHSGWPEFPCGGLYLRGLLLQYVGALLQLAGLTPELSTRGIAAVSSLAALPAAYLLGRRVHGPLIGTLAVGLLALSLWEVEVARFGRMYAPFQAAFLWYLVFFLRHVLDGRQRALWGMFTLTLVGILTWEGGVLLAFANILAPFLRSDPVRLSRRDVMYMAAAGALFVVLYTLTHIDFRTGAEPEPALSVESIPIAPQHPDGASWWPWILLG
ncbi:MAG: glycosyltransferase family 39 protein, partial [Steroidobacteraceae bacterium]